MSLIKSTAFYSIGSILPKFGALFFLPIYLRYLTPEEYGIVTSLQVLNSVLIIAFTFSLPRALYRIFYDYKSHIDQKKLVGTVFVSVFFIALTLLIVIILFKNQFNQIYSEISFYPFFLFALFSVFFASLQTIPQTILQIKEKPTTFISLGISLFILKSILILYFLIVMKEGAAGYLKAEMLSGFIFAPLYYIFIRDEIVITWNFSMLKSVMAFSLPILPGVISSWVLNLSDRIFISKFYSTTEVGIYSLGYQIAGLVLLFTTAFKSAYDPYFFRIANTKKRDEAVKILYKTNHIFLIILIAVSFGIAFFAKEVVIIFFNETYYPSYQIVPIISLGYFFSQNSALLNTMVYQEKKTKVVMYITIISAGVNIVLNFLLIPLWGILGAAIVTLISYFIIFILTYFLARRHFFVPYNWNHLIPLFAASIIIYVFFSFMDFHNIYYLLILKMTTLLAVLSIVFLKYKSSILGILFNK